MRAHRLVASQQPAVLCEIDVPEPGPGEVLVKVAGAGLCHSDLHLMHWPFPLEQPFTLGHETAGWVEALGAGVDGIDLGTPVLVHGAWGCGRCRRCQADQEQHCELSAGRAAGSGLMRDGGLADHLLVPAARHLVPLGGLDPRHWAPLDDAALTPYHAIRSVQHRCTPDNWAMVTGVGGLGHVAVQLLRELTGVRVLAVDVRDEALVLASELGADAVLRAGSGDDAAAVREITGGQGVGVVLDCVGNDATMALAAASVHPVSHIVVIGLGGGTLPFAYGALPFDCSVSTTFWGGVTELREVVALAERGRVRLDVEHVGLEDVGAAYERLAAGGVRGRIVALPNG